MRGTSPLPTCILASALLLATPAASGAQETSVLDALEALAEDNGSLYVEPLTVGLGIGLNTGFNATAAVHDVLGFDIGVRVVGALVPDEMDFFEAIPPSPVTVAHPDDPGRSVTTAYSPRGGGLSTPTVTGPGEGRIGQGDAIVFEPTGEFLDSLQSWGADPSRFNLPFPEGFDIPGIPFAVIQGSVGIPLGTDLTVRFIPAVETHEDVGDVEAFGFGIRHSVSQWFPAPLPVDLAVSFGWQDLSVGDYLDASGTNYGAVVSKDLGAITLYGAGSLISADVDVTYTFEGTEDVPPQRIRLSQKLDTTTRFAVGFNLDVLILDLSAEYALGGEMDTLSGQVGFSFR